MMSADWRMPAGAAGRDNRKNLMLLLAGDRDTVQ